MGAISTACSPRANSTSRDAWVPRQRRCGVRRAREREAVEDVGVDAEQLTTVLAGERRSDARRVDVVRQRDDPGLGGWGRGRPGDRQPRFRRSSPHRRVRGWSPRRARRVAGRRPLACVHLVPSVLRGPAPMNSHPQSYRRWAVDTTQGSGKIASRGATFRGHAERARTVAAVRARVLARGSGARRGRRRDVARGDRHGARTASHRPRPGVPGYLAKIARYPLWAISVRALVGAALIPLPVFLYAGTRYHYFAGTRARSTTSIRTRCSRA